MIEVIDPNGPAMNGTMQFLQVAVPVIWGAVGVLVLTWMSLLFRKWVKSEQWNKLLEALEEAVDNIQIKYVDWWKAASVDGKLTKEERQRAARMAWDQCLMTIKDPRVLTFASLLTWDAVESLIKRVVDKKRVSNVSVIIPGIATTMTTGDAYVATAHPISGSTNTNNPGAAVAGGGQV